MRVGLTCIQAIWRLRAVIGINRVCTEEGYWVLYFVDEHDRRIYGVTFSVGKNTVVTVGAVQGDATAVGGPIQEARHVQVSGCFFGVSAGKTD